MAWPVTFRVFPVPCTQMVRSAGKCPAVGRGSCIEVAPCQVVRGRYPGSGSLIMKPDAFAGMLRVCRLASAVDAENQAGMS